jgi:hypothetical protein
MKMLSCAAIKVQCVFPSTMENPQNAKTSINATSHACICAACIVHQRVTHNNNPFASLAGEEPNNPTDHTSINCSPNNVTITASNCAPSGSQLLAQPIMHKIVLAPGLVSTQPQPLHPTITP